MKCPKCGTDVESGYLQSTHSLSSIVWVGRLLPMGFSSWMMDAEPVSDEHKFSTLAIPTHICKQCKVLVGDYSKKA